MFGGNIWKSKPNTSRLQPANLNLPRRTNLNTGGMEERKEKGERRKGPEQTGA
jgi:hypothetical protein